MPISINCEFCNKEFKVKPSRHKRGVKYCSYNCLSAAKYTGKFIRSDGYVAIKVNGKFELEHRVKMELKIGRPLLSSEHVHHLNNIKHDNSDVNLIIVGIGEHISKFHACKKDPNKWIECTCFNCGIKFQRNKLESKSHPNTFCNRECYITGKKKRIVK